MFFRLLLSSVLVSSIALCTNTEQKPFTTEEFDAYIKNEFKAKHGIKSLKKQLKKNDSDALVKLLIQDPCVHNYLTQKYTPKTKGSKYVEALFYSSYRYKNDRIYETKDKFQKELAVLDIQTLYSECSFVTSKLKKNAPSNIHVEYAGDIYTTRESINQLSHSTAPHWNWAIFPMIKDGHSSLIVTKSDKSEKNTAVSFNLRFTLKNCDAKISSYLEPRFNYYKKDEQYIPYFVQNHKADQGPLFAEEVPFVTRGYYSAEFEGQSSKLMMYVLAKATLQALEKEQYTLEKINTISADAKKLFDEGIEEKNQEKKEAAYKKFQLVGTLLHNAIAHYLPYYKNENGILSEKSNQEISEYNNAYEWNLQREFLADLFYSQNSTEEVQK